MKRITLLTLVFVSQALFAKPEQVDVISLINLSLEELLEVDVNTATLTQQRQATTPAAFTVFTRAEIERLAVDYLHELLAFVPGYQTTRELDFSYQYSMSSRGRKTGAAGREVLFLLDGTPVNEPRNGNAGGMFMFPVEHIEKVEVLRGPGSALYGSNAITGVVNVTSRNKEHSLKVDIGYQGKQQIDTFFSNNLNDWQLAWGLSMEHDSGHDYSVPDTFSAQRVTTKDPYTQKRISLKGYKGDSTFNLVHREIDSEQFYNTARISNQYNFSHQANSLISFTQRLTIPRLSFSQLSASWVYSTSRNGNQSTAENAFLRLSSPPSSAPLYGYGEFQTSRVRIDWQNQLQLDDDNLLLFGVEARNEEVIKAKGYTNYDLVGLTNRDFPIEYYGQLGPGVDIAEQEAMLSAGIYSQYQFESENGLSATLGARYDNYEHFASRLSPRLSLVYPTINNGYLKLLYGESFRIPNFTEVSFKNTVTVASNKNLQHEIAKTWDFIWLQQWSKGQLQLGAFATVFESPIVNDVQNGVRNFINGDDESSEGAELELQYQPNESQFYRVTASHFFTLSDTAYREAKDTFSFHANFQLRNTNINLSTAYAAKRHFINPDNKLAAVPSFWVANIKVSYLISSNWSLAVQAKNVFNQQYFSPPIGNSLTEAIPNRGLESSVSIKYLFL